MENLLLISIVIEALIAVLAFLCVLKKRIYMIGFVVTFLIYVVYDLSRLYQLDLDPMLLAGGFLVATLTALYSMWNLYKRS